MSGRTQRGKDRVEQDRISGKGKLMGWIVADAVLLTACRKSKYNTTYQDGKFLHETKFGTKLAIFGLLGIILTIFASK
jgi:hypothetical protein